MAINTRCLSVCSSSKTTSSISISRSQRSFSNLRACNSRTATCEANTHAHTCHGTLGETSSLCSAVHWFFRTITTASYSFRLCWLRRRIFCFSQHQPLVIANPSANLKTRWGGDKKDGLRNKLHALPSLHFALRQTRRLAVQELESFRKERDPMQWTDHRKK